MELGDNKAAEVQFSEATSLDCKSWMAIQGLAGCRRLEKRYGEAADLILKAMEVVPATMALATEKLQQDLISIYLAQGGPGLHRAVDLAERACKESPRDSERVVLYIKALYGIRNFDGILAVVRGFLRLEDEFETEDSKSWRLVALFGAIEEMGRGLRATGSIDLVRPLLDRFIKASFDGLDFSTEPWMAMWFVEFLYDFYDDMDEARELCERILDPAFEQNLRVDYKWAYEYPLISCLDHMAKICYLEALSSHENGREVDTWLEKLTGLRELAKDRISVPDSQLLAATAYRTIGGCYENKWRPLLRHEIVTELRSLSQAAEGQGRPWSVEVSHSIGRLGVLLTAAGDPDNAMAADALALDAEPPLQTQAPDTAPQLQVTPFGNSRYICDGICTARNFKYNAVYAELFWCTECLDTCFCGLCHEIVKSGKLPYRRCSPTHRFVRAFPVSLEMKGVAGWAGADVPVEEWRVNSEWVNKLLHEWSCISGCGD